MAFLDSSAAALRCVRVVRSLPDAALILTPRTNLVDHKYSGLQVGDYKELSNLTFSISMRTDWTLARSIPSSVRAGAAEYWYAIGVHAAAGRWERGILMDKG